MAEGLNLVFGVLAILAIVAIVLVVTALAIGALLRDKHGTSGSLSTAALNALLRYDVLVALGLSDAAAVRADVAARPTPK